MNQPTLFDLEAFTLSSPPTPLYDPAWDEVEETAPQHIAPETRWNPAHFGEVPRKLSDNGQLTIFFDDSEEPPDPDDYLNLDDYELNLDDYEQAWEQWELRVGAQVTSDTTVESCVGAQVSHVTQKTAPQHDTHWVEKYWVKRSGNKYWYYRYCWMVGRKKNRLYLGSVNSAQVKRKKADVEIAMKKGKLPIEIEQLIRSWRGTKSDE
ncbi:DUF4102 domain-containing protein [uncultured Nostoc sp.]|uniref:DUF4102 domain-containing protein n=1 Tax=uncultured Nostoc sp. TaxID=340711 RepID=UPI0035C972AF